MGDFLAIAQPSIMYLTAADQVVQDMLDALQGMYQGTAPDAAMQTLQDKATDAVKQAGLLKILLEARGSRRSAPLSLPVALVSLFRGLASRSSTAAATRLCVSSGLLIPEIQKRISGAGHLHYPGHRFSFSARRFSEKHEAKPPTPVLLPSCWSCSASRSIPWASACGPASSQRNWAIGQADNWFFNGLDNYLRLFKDAAFRNAIWVTLYFTVLSVIVELVVGLAIALLLSRNVRGSWFFRSAVVFPLMVSDIVAAVIFSTLLDPTLGTVNYFLGQLGLPQPDWSAIRTS